MREIMRTNDIVTLSFAQSVLAQAGVECITADQHMSITEGSVGMFPRRLLVIDEDQAAARQALTEAGLADWLIEP